MRNVGKLFRLQRAIHPQVIFSDTNIGMGIAKNIIEEKLQGVRG